MRIPFVDVHSTTWYDINKFATHITWYITLEEGRYGTVVLEQRAPGGSDT